MIVNRGSEELRVELLRCEHQRDQLEAAQLDLYEMSRAVVDERSASAFIARSKVVAARVEYNIDRGDCPLNLLKRAVNCYRHCSCVESKRK